MSISLLQFVAKIIFIAFISTINNLKTIIVNDDIKSLNVVNQIQEYKTIVKYNSKIPSNVTKTVIEGVNGITYQVDDEIKTLVKKVDKVVEVGTGAYGEYTGVLTAYGPDCYGCDPNGYTYCQTKNGNWHSLVNDGIYYNDDEYGAIRILAADHRRFPCGTIIEINNSNHKKLIGIVLDTGGGMISAYNQGWNLVDLAYESQSELPHGTNNNTKFSVKRWGW